MGYSKYEMGLPLISGIAHPMLWPKSTNIPVCFEDCLYNSENLNDCVIINWKKKILGEVVDNYQLKFWNINWSVIDANEWWYVWDYYVSDKAGPQYKDNFNTAIWKRVFNKVPLVAYIIATLFPCY